MAFACERPSSTVPETSRRTSIITINGGNPATIADAIFRLGSARVQFNVALEEALKALAVKNGITEALKELDTAPLESPVPPRRAFGVIFAQGRGSIGLQHSTR
jgi:hypothetical protein